MCVRIVDLLCPRVGDYYYLLINLLSLIF
jgi:hypothetical protein